MPGKNNVLVICRKLGDLALVDQSMGGSRQSVIVASDYTDVQQVRLATAERFRTPRVILREDRANATVSAPPRSSLSRRQ